MAGLPVYLLDFPRRPCFVLTGTETTKVKGMFHQWCVRAYPYSALLVGHESGQVVQTYGLVELEDGTVHEVDPKAIIFADGGEFLATAFLDLTKKEEPDHEHEH